jgi:SAM-dependent methyltransferase
MTMGVTVHEFRVLAALSKAGALAGNVMTLGRQNTFFKSRDALSISHAYGLNLSPETCDALEAERFADRLFQELGAKRFNSIDASSYEGASIIKDLNVDFGKGDVESADFVYDGGTTEHVFDVSAVFRNLTRIVKPRGFFFGACPANGQPGHGFYQFSPEFYYRTLAFHGFEVERLYLVAIQFPAQWYRVDDPSKFKQRITFLSAEPIYAFVVARRTGEPSKDTAPMQSDYAFGNWKTGKDHLTWDRSFRAKLYRLLHRVVVLRLLWSLNVLARHAFLVGNAVWATSPGVCRVDIDADLQALVGEIRKL